MISVIIPTFKDNFRLSLCLDALKCQSLGSADYEVIVVDNDPGASAKEIVSKYKDIQYFVEAKKGSYAARNAGIAIAKGNILAFTDSDCIPDVDWLKNMQEFFMLTPDLDWIGGKIQIFPKDPNSENAVELMERLFSFNQKKNVLVRNGAVTANLAIRDSAFKKYGLFDGEQMSGGDMFWTTNAAKCGAKYLYAENALVMHPARSTLKEINSKTARVIKGAYQVSAKGMAVPGLKITDIIKDLLPPFPAFLVAMQKAKFKFWLGCKLFFVLWSVKLHRALYKIVEKIKR